MMVCLIFKEIPSGGAGYSLDSNVICGYGTPMY